MQRTFVSDLNDTVSGEVMLRGWVHRLRELAKTTFIVLHDCSGTVQCVADPTTTRELALHLDAAIEVRGRIRRDERSRTGFEVDATSVSVLNAAAHGLPFNSSADITNVPVDVLLDYRALSLRNEIVGDTFRIQASILTALREFLDANRFTEIISSKIVGGGTEGGTNLFEIKYFDRAAYLAQSPQFYKNE